MTCHLLWRHVPKGAYDAACLRPFRVTHQDRDAEVGDFDDVVLLRMSTFAGFRSRWITPSRCAAPTPAHTCRKIRSASSSRKRVPRRLCRRMMRSSPSPSMYCITRYRFAALHGDRPEMDDVRVIDPRKSPSLRERPRPDVLAMGKLRPDSLHNHFAPGVDVARK